MCGHMPSDVEKRCGKGVTKFALSLSRLCHIYHQRYRTQVLCFCRYGHFGTMFETLLREDTASEQWDTYFVVDGHWPEEDCLETYEVNVALCCSTSCLSRQGRVWTGLIV